MNKLDRADIAYIRKARKSAIFHPLREVIAEIERDRRDRTKAKSKSAVKCRFANEREKREQAERLPFPARIGTLEEMEGDREREAADVNMSEAMNEEMESHMPEAVQSEDSYFASLPDSESIDIKQLLDIEIEKHDVELRGASKKGKVYEDGFVAGLKHVRENLVGLRVVEVDDIPEVSRIKTEQWKSGS